MQLQEDIYDEVVRLSEQGDEHAENGQYATAIKYYDDALALLPEPKNIWEAATWLYAAIGDAQFNRSRYGLAMDAYQNALQSPDGNTGDAKECFMRAYMLDGKDIFEGKEPGYYELIREEAEKEPTQDEKKEIEKNIPKGFMPPGWDKGLPPRSDN